MANPNVVQITDTNFESEVVNSPTPVLVDFWAEWCGPCKMIAPILDEIAEEKAGAVKIAKINVDHAPSLAAQFQIRSIPTLLFFKDGQVREQIIGATSKRALVEKLEALA